MYHKTSSYAVVNIVLAKEESMCDYKLVGKDEVKEMMSCSDEMAYKVIRQLKSP